MSIIKSIYDKVYEVITRLNPFFWNIFFLSALLLSLLVGFGYLSYFQSGNLKFSDNTKELLKKTQATHDFISNVIANQDTTMEIFENIRIQVENGIIQLDCDTLKEVSTHLESINDQIGKLNQAKNEGIGNLGKLTSTLEINNTVIEKAVGNKRKLFNVQLGILAFFIVCIMIILHQTIQKKAKYSENEQEQTKLDKSSNKTILDLTNELTILRKSKGVKADVENLFIELQVKNIEISKLGTKNEILKDQVTQLEGEITRLNKKIVDCKESKDGK